MWFQFASGEEILSIERQIFIPEYSAPAGNFFRAPDHFKDKLVREGGCKALGAPPEGVPDNLPDVKFYEPKLDTTSSAILDLKQALSDERSNSSAMRAEMAAALHERDMALLKIHEMAEEIISLKSKLEDAGVEDEE